MGEKTGIEWTDHTFNAWIGCTKVSPACAHCYAERDNRRYKWNGGAWGPGALRKVTSAANWKAPIRWAKAAREADVREKVFLNSLSDTFDLEAPREARMNLWALISWTSDALDWQILTKRPENIAAIMREDGLHERFFLDHRVWLGTTVENQEYARRRIAPLVQVLAWFHFLSCEPLLGELDLFELRSCCSCSGGDIDENCPGEFQLIDGINWVICGGESGAEARSMHLKWARRLRDQCAEASVPFFFKQWGQWRPTEDPKIAAARGLALDDCMTWSYKKDNGAVLDGVEHKAFPGGVA